MAIFETKERRQMFGIAVMVLTAWLFAYVSIATLTKLTGMRPDFSAPSAVAIQK